MAKDDVVTFNSDPSKWDTLSKTIKNVMEARGKGKIAPGHYVVYKDDGSVSSGPHKSPEEAKKHLEKNHKSDTKKVEILNHHDLRKSWDYFDGKD